MRQCNQKAKAEVFRTLFPLIEVEYFPGPVFLHAPVHSDCDIAAFAAAGRQEHVTLSAPANYQGQENRAAVDGVAARIRIAGVTASAGRALHLPGWRLMIIVERAPKLLIESMEEIRDCES